MGLKLKDRNRLNNPRRPFWYIDQLSVSGHVTFAQLLMLVSINKLLFKKILAHATQHKADEN